MPLYTYRCKNCKSDTEEFQHIRDEPLEWCPACQKHTLSRVPALPHTSHKEFSDPIEMHSIALNHPDDIRAFQQRNPDVRISTNTRDPLYGVPIARSRHEKLGILKKEGWQESK